MRLKTLNLGGCGAVKSLEPLRGMPLTDFAFSPHAGLDLSPLADAPIEDLVINFGDDTLSLAALRNLRYVSLGSTAWRSCRICRHFPDGCWMPSALCLFLGVICLPWATCPASALISLDAPTLSISLR